MSEVHENVIDQTAVNERIAADNASFEAMLRQETSSEYGKKIRARVKLLAIELFTTGIGTIEDVYDYLHSPGQGVGGYHGAVVDTLPDSVSAMNAIRHDMERVAALNNRDGGYTPEHAANRVVSSLDSMLFAEKCKEVAVDHPDMANELDDVWKLRVRHAIEAAVGFVKSKTKNSANKAVKTFGHEALREARNRYNQKRYGN